jgi:hypothetical protein
VSLVVLIVAATTLVATMSPASDADARPAEPAQRTEQQIADELQRIGTTLERSQAAGDTKADAAGQMFTALAAAEAERVAQLQAFLAAAAEAERVAAERAAAERAAASRASMGGGWAALRRCESGGNYGAVSASGTYRGAYQFSRSTWNAVAARSHPHLVGVDPAAAAPADQDAMALSLYRSSGSRPWPHCGKHL